MYKLTWMERMGCSVLKQGKIPNHIAFIMDGNRRYAKQLKKEPTRGHFYGVESLKKCLLMCCEIEVKIASFYCFSIENFKRSEQQVDTLMQLCIDTFKQLSEVSELLRHYEIKVNVVGDLSLVKEDVRQMLDKLEERTKDFNKMTINLCFAYDSLYEIQTALHQLDAENRNYRSFMQKLAIPEYVDVIVRTSNEKRLSNFMLPQCAYAQITILKQNWPQLNLWSFVKVIMDYNMNYNEIQKQKLLILEKNEEKDVSSLKIKSL